MNEQVIHQTKKSSLIKRSAVLVLLFLAVYFLATYLAMPAAWKHYERKHPMLADIPGITHTASGIPGDPLNVVLIGTKAELVRIMLDAKWYPADPLSLKSCLEIAEATVFKRTYDDAPVSSLFLFGRKEDLAFEQPVGDNPRERHHVRFWKTAKFDGDGSPIWIGSAIFDKKVGFSSTTGQITHITAPDIDVERDYLMQCLQKTGHLAKQYIIKNFHTVHTGKNGGGDPWTTDGNLDVGVINLK